MDPPPVRRRSPTSWLPRLRGDGPGSPPDGRSDIQAPPPTRGWTQGNVRKNVRKSGSPAYAGMDRTPRAGRNGWSRLPRLRGDGPIARDEGIPDDGAPPPTRGWTPTLPEPPCTGHGSPAYAGMDPNTRERGHDREGLPRLRGDGPQHLPNHLVLDMAPPPTRGWTRVPQTLSIFVLGSPAYAGMDPMTCIS